jgi:hypothetical protein
MSINTDAHVPSARDAGTTPRYAQGGEDRQPNRRR